MALSYAPRSSIDDVRTIFDPELIETAEEVISHIIP
jgi:hypothetical protein